MKTFAAQILAASAGLVAMSATASAQSVSSAGHETVRVTVSDIDLHSAAGRQTLNHRARAAAETACGISAGRGAADAASAAICHDTFVQAVNEAADARMARAGAQLASRR